MNDEHHEHDNHTTFDGGHQNDEPRQRPISDSGFSGHGFGEDDEFAVVDEPKKSISSGTVLLLLVVLLAAGGLWSMRSLAVAMAGNRSDKKLDSTIEQFLESLSGNRPEASRNNLVLGGGFERDAGNVLVDDRTEKQVSVDEVKQNPFVSFLEPKAAPTPIATGDDVDRAAQERLRARERRISDFETAAAKLRVLMILGSGAGRGTPMANISGRVVHVGDRLFDDRLSVEFEVEEIADGMVMLVAKDLELDLEYEIILRLHRN